MYTPIHFPECGSTNDEALRLFNNGTAGHGAVITANKQTKGRGRQDRQWVSEKGNLYASLIVVPNSHCERKQSEARSNPENHTQEGWIASSALTPPRNDGENISNWPQLSFVMALAVAGAVIECLPGPAAKTVTLKWPNDVLVAGKKIAGILLEVAENPKQEKALVIGFGINCAHHPEQINQPAINLKALGASQTDPPTILGIILKKFDDYYAIWAGQGFAPIRAAWLEKAQGLGATIIINQGNQKKQGIFHDIDAQSGALILKNQDGSLVPISAGDVYFENASCH